MPEDLSQLSDEELDSRISSAQKKLSVNSLSDEELDARIQELSGIDVSPLPIREPIQMIPPGVSPNFPGGLVDEPSSEEISLRERGIETEQGADVGRFSAGFASNIDNAVNFMQQALTKDFQEKGLIGEDEVATVQLDQQTGKLLFLDPKTKRLTTIDESSLTTEDLLEGIGESLPVVGEILGSIGGLTLGGSGGSAGTPAGTVAGAVVGEAAGSAIGAGAGESLRVQIGELLGVNPDLSVKDILLSAAPKAGTAGITSLVGSGIFIGGARALRGASVVGSGRVGEITVEEAQIALKGVQGGKELEDEVNTVLSAAGRDERLNLTLPNLVDDPVLLAKQEQLAAGSRGSSIAFNEELAIREAQNQDAIIAYFDILSPRAGKTREQAGREIGEMLQKRANLLKNAKEEARRRVNEGKNAIEEISPVEKAFEGKNIREVVENQARVAVAVEDVMWQDFRKSIGFNPETLSSSIQAELTPDLSRRLTSFQARADRALTTTESQRLGSVAQGRILEDGPKDINDIINTIKSVRKRIREAKSPNVTRETQDVALLKELEEGLVVFRDKVLREQNPVAYQKLQIAEQVTRERIARYESGIVQTLLKKNADGTFELADGGVLAKIVGDKNGTAATELANAAIGNPALSQSFRNFAFSLYRTTVQDPRTGLLDITRHNKFMEQYGEVIKPFFKEKDFAKISRFGEFSKVTSNANIKLNAIEKAYKRSFRAKTVGLNSEELTKAIFSTSKTKASKTTFTTKETVRLVTLIKRADPALKEALEEGARDHISRVIYDRQNDAVNFKAVDKLILDQGEKIRTIFGAKYLRDLKVLAEVQKRITRLPARTLANPSETLTLQLGRSLFGPLSKKQRFATATRKIAFTTRQNAMRRLISNPEKLAEFIALRNQRLTNTKVVSFLSSVGAASLIDEQF